MKQIGTVLMMLAGSTSLVVAQGPRTTPLGVMGPAPVRTSVVVTPKVVEAKVIEPVEVGATAPSAAEPSIDELVQQSASKHGVDPLLVHSVIKAESNYNPRAVSNKGAQGLMQLMPSTARDLGVRDPLNAKENIEAGVKYLKYLQSQFGDPALALAAYNAGEGAVRRYGNWIPPYPETLDYVVKVARNYREAKAAAAQQVQNSRTKPVATAAVVQTKPELKNEAPPEPPPAPLQYYYDAQGRLIIRTVN